MGQFGVQSGQIGGMYYEKQQLQYVDLLVGRLFQLRMHMFIIIYF